MYHLTDTERQLLYKLSQGDRKATEQVYSQNYSIVTKWLYKNGCTVDDADDVFQEGMMVLFGKVQEAEFSLSCTINTYLFAICKHVWYKKLQQIKKAPATYFDDTHEDAPMSAIAAEEELNVHHERETHFGYLESALEQLGEPCRSLLQAYYHKDMSMHQIAANFGYTNPENAKTQKYKCLTRLKKLFYSHHQDK